MEVTEPQHITDTVRESIVDAVRIGIGHAIATIEDYAADYPNSKPHCDRLITMLRSHSAIAAVQDPT